MGWADCGNDRAGRPIGYAFEATCDHPGCTKKIDRGISFACGGMHGEDEYSCEGYFCEEHTDTICTPNDRWIPVCFDCKRLWEEECDTLEDDE
jgi:hypothetical protein